jgi:hypothetical protein
MRAKSKVFALTTGKVMGFRVASLLGEPENARIKADATSQQSLA